MKNNELPKNQEDLVNDIDFIPIIYKKYSKINYLLLVENNGEYYEHITGKKVFAKKDIASCGYELYTYQLGEVYNCLIQR